MEKSSEGIPGLLTRENKETHHCVGSDFLVFILFLLFLFICCCFCFFKIGPCFVA
jgi:hypothetical protein